MRGMRTAFGLISLLLSLLCSAGVALYVWGCTVRLRDERRDWAEFPALLSEHGRETALFGGLLLLGFVLLIAGISLLTHSDPPA
jgi:hypothetical protein